VALLEQAPGIDVHSKSYMPLEMGGGQVSRLFNPLLLAVMALLNEQPIHAYGMARAMRKRRMEMCIKLNYGSLYHTVESLWRSGLIAPVEAEREGRRAERTVYALTQAGRDQLLELLRDLIRDPVREYNCFEAGVCFLGNLSAEEAAGLLEQRASAIEAEVSRRRELLKAFRERGLTRRSLLEIEHAQIAQEAELQWIRQLIQEMEEGKLEWRARHDQVVTVEETR